MDYISVTYGIPEPNKSISLVHCYVVGVAVEYYGNVVGWKLAGGVGDEETGFSYRRIAHNHQLYVLHRSTVGNLARSGITLA